MEAFSEVVAILAMIIAVAGALLSIVISCQGFGGR